jgi:citrate lyase beta subunit
VSRAIDGLIREVQLDRANGLQGKTAIHPSHVAVVNALSVVSSEEFRDARAVLDAGRGSGVLASGHGNKMNEIRPHTSWAHRTALRAQVFGVAADGVSFVDLLVASLPR